MLLKFQMTYEIESIFYYIKNWQQIDLKGDAKHLPNRFSANFLIFRLHLFLSVSPIALNANNESNIFYLALDNSDI